MPMVSEASASPNRTFRARKNSVLTTVTRRNGTHRSQLGYRSGPLSKEEVASLETKSRMGNTFSLIKTNELLSEDPHGPSAKFNSTRSWPEHDRDYTETIYRPTGFSYSCEYSLLYAGTTYKYPYSVEGSIGVDRLLTGFMPSLPGTSTLSAMAGQMLRESRPPERGFDLARFAGEQREAHLLFRASNYRPKNIGEASGAYINYVFGLKPTGSDLGKLAELVLRSDMPIRNLLGAEKIREKKYRTKTLLSDGGSGETRVVNGGTPADYEIQMGSMMTKFSYLIPISGSVTDGNMLIPVLRYSYTRQQTLRTHATWEYFIPQPADIQTRLDFYKEKSRALLSSAKLTEATVYELTPWTWLADWFVDFGGLLRYQRAVVDNQIVAVSSGYSLWEEYTGIVKYAERQVSPYATGINPNQKPTKDNFTPVTTSIRWRRHYRRGGNPYSISPTWSLTNQQWGILGALGMARLAGVPIKKL